MPRGSQFWSVDIYMDIHSSRCLLSTAYLAPVSAYHVMLNGASVFMEQWESYQKQTYRNRCRILTSNGVMDLVIPVEKQRTSKQLIRDMRISDHGDWQTQHWRCIESAYRNSPYFEFFEDDIQPFYARKWSFLWDFNCELMFKILELLDVEIDVKFTETYQESITFEGVDFRNSIHPKKETFFFVKKYYQVFNDRYGFAPELSIIDLLFNMGNESLLLLKD